MVPGLSRAGGPFDGQVRASPKLSEPCDVAHGAAHGVRTLKEDVAGAGAFETNASTIAHPVGDPRLPEMAHETRTPCRGHPQGQLAPQSDRKPVARIVWRDSRQLGSLGHAVAVACRFGVEAEATFEVVGGDVTPSVLGLGSLGGVVAERLSALGVNVLGLCRSGKPRPHVSRVFSPDNWRSMLPLCDALVLTTPLTPQTHGMLDAAALAALPAGAVLVNVARGELVDERALLESVRQGRLRAAVLDVFDREPLPADSPLWTEPRIWVTPHVAAPSEVDLVADEFAINYSRFIDGAPLVNLVDRERGY